MQKFREIQGINEQIHKCEYINRQIHKYEINKLIHEHKQTNNFINMQKKEIQKSIYFEYTNIPIHKAYLNTKTQIS